MKLILLCLLLLIGICLGGKSAVVELKNNHTKRLYGDRFSVTAEPAFVKRYRMPLKEGLLQKETGHPI